MSGKNTAGSMDSRILEAALEIFSEKGYFAATIRDISERAGCNQVTVYRHFEDKQSLFMKVVETYHVFHFDEDALNARLTYINLHTDLTIMSDAFFDLVFSHVRILRIFINDAPSFPAISKYTWFIPNDLMEFTVNYLEAMYMNQIRNTVRDIIAESFLAYIVRTCLRKNAHEGYNEKSRDLTRTVRKEMEPNVDLTMEMILREVNRQGA